MHTMPHQRAEHSGPRSIPGVRRGWLTAVALGIGGVLAIALSLTSSIGARRETSYLYRTEDIPFGTKTVEVAYLPLGTKRTYPGYAGVRRVLREVTYEGILGMRREVASRVVKEQVIQHPVSAMVLVGTDSKSPKSAKLSSTPEISRRRSTPQVSAARPSASRPSAPKPSAPRLSISGLRMAKPDPVESEPAASTSPKPRSRAKKPAPRRPRYRNRLNLARTQPIAQSVVRPRRLKRSTPVNQPGLPPPSGEPGLPPPS